MSTRKVTVGLSLISVLAASLLMSIDSVLAQGSGISIVKDATLKKDKAYAPNPAQVKAGDIVTWINKDRTIHTVTSGILGLPGAGSEFNSNTILANASFKFIFDEAGEYDYYCELHPTMVGKVIVS